jgi:hypothetical protein
MSNLISRDLAALITLAAFAVLYGCAAVATVRRKRKPPSG